MIAGGLADARRLARQAQVMETTTMAFLTRAGLVAGAAALDAGCGDGQVMIAMARRAGPARPGGGGGRGRRCAGDRASGGGPVACARLVRPDAAHLGAAGAFDLVYARLLPSHLIDPFAALRAMRAAARPR
jgi:ubiquinone/menaquinone biosynthesis C-methylase UbiE